MWRRERRGVPLWSVYVARVIPFIPYTILLLLLPPGSLLFPAFPSRNMPRYHKFPFSSSSTLTGTIFCSLDPKTFSWPSVSHCVCFRNEKRKKGRETLCDWLAYFWFFYAHSALVPFVRLHILSLFFVCLFLVPSRPLNYTLRRGWVSFRLVIILNEIIN